MAEVTAAQVKALRDKTGAGMMDCKAALRESGGDEEKAIRFLREQGLAMAARKAGRATREGLVASYVHAGGKIGVLIEVTCETDFVARTDDFRQLARDLAMQVAASVPRYVQRQEVPPEEIQREREIYEVQARQSGKPPPVVERVVQGKLERFFADVCLMEQPFIKDPQRTVHDLITDAVARLGENIAVQRFVRFQLGEDAAPPPEAGAS